MDFKENKLHLNLRVMWDIGIPVAFTSTLDIDKNGEIQTLYTLTAPKYSKVEFSSFDKDAVLQHLDNTLHNVFVVMKLLGNEILVRPYDVGQIAQVVKEILGVGIDTSETRFISSDSMPEERCSLRFGGSKSLDLYPINFQALLGLHKALDQIEGAYPKVSFTNVDPDKLKAAFLAVV